MNQRCSPAEISLWHLPEGVAFVVANGRSMLSALRAWRGLSALQLSEASGVDLVILMMAEKGFELEADERIALAAALSVDQRLLLSQQLGWSQRTRSTYP